MIYRRNVLPSLVAALFLTFATSIAGAATLLVLNKNDATLSFFDPVTGKASTTIPTGEGPHEIELSSDGKLAFIGNYGSQTPGNTLSVVDTQTRKELRRVDLGELKRPHGLAFLDGKLYFTSEATRKVARFDPMSNSVDWQFETGQNATHMVLATRDGSKLFAANIGSNTVSVLEREGSQWKQTLVPVGAGPEGMDLSPNGKELWVAHSRDGGISVIDIASKRVAHTIDAKTQRSNRLKFTPDGKMILVSDLTAGELVAFDTSSRLPIARLKLGRVPTGILMAPDGNAYVACSGDNHIAVIDLKTLKMTKTIATGGSPDGMAWLK
ncbi:MAG TPA: cytochrome D1 domain-containing protein [Steroidobacteraceae bacterium]|nr:cytochrome D1 domain-containing protein [Steroidobacteraceae bacterium]